MHDFVLYTTGYPPVHGIQHHHQLVPHQHVAQQSLQTTLQPQNPMPHLMHAAAGNFCFKAS